MKAIIIDTETTGLAAQVDRVIEVGLVFVSEGEVVAVLETLVKPAGLQDIRWAEQSGIRPEDVEHAPSFAEIAGFLHYLLAMADEIVGYRLAFDLAFIRNEFARCGLAMPVRIHTDVMVKRQTLKAACEANGIEAPPDFEWHRALADAIMTYRLWRKLTSEGKKEEESPKGGRFIPRF